MSSGSGADASDRNAALDRLSGPQLVAYLRTTIRRADYDAAARVLDARDRRLAEVQAALAEAQAVLAEVQPGLADARAELEALRENYHALQAAHRGPIRLPSRGAIAAPAPRGDGRDEVIDLCDSGGDDDDDWEEGEFRPDAAGVSCKAKGPAPEGREGRRAGVSCKRNAPVGSSDDDDDRIPLSQLMKKRRGPQPVPNGEPKKGHGDVQANSVGPSLGDHPPERPPVNRGAPKASAGQRGGASQQLKVAAVEQGKGRICQSREAGGLSRAMPTLPPTDSAVGNNSQKKSSKADGAEDGARIGGKQGSAAGPPFQVRESARAGAETPKENTGSALDATVSLVLNTIREQGKTNGGMHKMKAPLETNGFGEKACMVARDIREQQKTQGQVLKTDVLQGTNGIGQQNVKLGTVQNREVSDGARLRTSDKQVSSSLKPNNQLTLHSEQMPSERPTSLQPNNQLTLHSEKMPVKSSLPSEVTRNWESASEVYTSCLVNNEICMQAACALLRQKKLSIQEGKDGYTVVNKSDVHRAASLAEFLLDGNLQGPLKRTAEELAKRDSGGVDLLARVAMGFSEQLFSIYRNKEDPYFR